jgi:hypothetical protein
VYNSIGLNSQPLFGHYLAGLTDLEAMLRDAPKAFTLEFVACFLERTRAHYVLLHYREAAGRLELCPHSGQVLGGKKISRLENTGK